MNDFYKSLRRNEGGKSVRGKWVEMEKVTKRKGGVGTGEGE